jgi:hypothetical protein
MLIRADLTVDGFTRASNYVNKNGEHPRVLTTMIWYNIVFKQEDLKDGNWLYIGKESETEIRAQWNSLKLCRDWVPIIKD